MGGCGRVCGRACLLLASNSFIHKLIIVPGAMFCAETPCPIFRSFSKFQSSIECVFACVLFNQLNRVRKRCFRPSWHHSMVHASIQAILQTIPTPLSNLHRIHQRRYLQNPRWLPPTTTAADSGRPKAKQAAPAVPHLPFFKSSSSPRPSERVAIPSPHFQASVPRLRAGCSA